MDISLSVEINVGNNYHLHVARYSDACYRYSFNLLCDVSLCLNKYMNGCLGRATVDDGRQYLLGPRDHPKMTQQEPMTSYSLVLSAVVTVLECQCCATLLHNNSACLLTATSAWYVFTLLLTVLCRMPPMLKRLVYGSNMCSRCMTSAF